MTVATPFPLLLYTLAVIEFPVYLALLSSFHPANVYPVFVGVLIFDTSEYFKFLVTVDVEPSKLPPFGFICNLYDFSSHLAYNVTF